MVHAVRVDIAHFIFALLSLSEGPVKGLTPDNDAFYRCLLGLSEELGLAHATLFARKGVDFHVHVKVGVFWPSSMGKLQASSLQSWLLLRIVTRLLLPGS